jgi:hypothetical protein
MAAGSADQPPPEPAPDERYGIVAFVRVRKDDGRSLILYSRGADDARAVSASDPEPAGEDQPA